MYSDDVVHYGILRRSGRYPYGSGGEMLEVINRLAKEGMSQVEIAEALGMSTTELRSQKTLAKGARDEENRLFIVREKDAGKSIASIARTTGLPEQTVRDMLKPTANAKYREILQIADVLKESIAKDKYIDIGEGVELYLGISDVKLGAAVRLLENQGFKRHYLREEQLGTGKPTSYKVLTEEDVEFRDVFNNRHMLGIPNYISRNGGPLEPLKPVNNLDSSRITVVYNSDKDGLIELRSGVPDISLGAKRYAQVRIGVDGTHYIKGMAIHADNLPSDIVFYTSKSNTGDKLKALKLQEADPANPFGSRTVPKTYVDKDGVEKTSGLNLVYEEGEWSSWSKNLSSQFLSKQDPKLAKAQLDLALDRRKAEFDEIMGLTNETVKAHLLSEFANTADSAAVKLKAAALPRQTTAVLIPAPSMKPNEIFAPNYQDGERVVLIRHPHGSTSEIPTLVVNNKNRLMSKQLGKDARDAVAIHPSQAERLSGADFDGDSVIVLPATRQIRTTPALEGLKGFDPKKAYPPFEGMKPITKQQKELKMGDVSNLITDMTIKGAPDSEIVRAIRHSMVIIDSEKHNLNWTQSRIDNGISALKAKYQGGPTSGASTLISRAKSEERVPRRKDVYNIDPTTGKKIWTYTEEEWTDKSGVVHPKMTKSTKMYETDDAFRLSSGTVMETVYADHANALKGLGNQARKNLLNVKPTPYNPQARVTYKKEVDSLAGKLYLAMRNQPLERRAQLVAGEIYRGKKQANPDLSRKDSKTEKGRALLQARIRVGAKKPTIQLTPREWEAIQMGAVTQTMLKKILRNSDMDQVRALATPRTTLPLSSGKILRAKALLNAGYTSAEVASAVGATQSQILNLDRGK